MSQEQIEDILDGGEEVGVDERIPSKRDVKVIAIRRYEDVLYRVTFLSNYDNGIDWLSAKVELVEEYTETITVTKYRVKTDT